MAKRKKFLMEQGEPLSIPANMVAHIATINFYSGIEAGIKEAVKALRSKEAKDYEKHEELVPREYWADWLESRFGKGKE
jgi:amino acid permease